MHLRQWQKVQEVLSDVIFARDLVYTDYNHRGAGCQRLTSTFNVFVPSLVRRITPSKNCVRSLRLWSRAPDDVFYRKGIGADAGVECYMRHRDGSETGWQTKYFFKFDSGQVTQLDKSIKQALAKHPRLNRYIVCIPFDLFDQRSGKGKTQLQRWQDWVKKWKSAATKKRKLAIELWGHSELVERLGRDNPLYSGRAAFWFDETFLTSAWFTSRFERARDGLGQRYTPETNVELPIRRTILGLCRDRSVLDQVQLWGEKLEEARYDVIDRLKRLTVSGGLIAEIAAVEATTSALSSLLSTTPDDPAYIFPHRTYQVARKRGPGGGRTSHARRSQYQSDSSQGRRRCPISVP
ncbi:hypothetical protein [Nitrobacter sp.]|uniref:hypothetical protein n=1 Tax=Nitrobacter sp. TaxID=29420 RepID=UPI003F653436